MEDNQAFRALFTLPPVQAGSSTSLTVPETPAPKDVTGDRELDAVLWLRACIKTGHAALIAPALEAFEKIKTPAENLEKRYSDYLRRTSGGNAIVVVLGSLGFADLESLAKRSMEKLAKRHDALSRFGSIDNLFADTLAETACKAALKGLRKKKEALWGYDSAKADQRFIQHAELVPATLSDCLHALEYEHCLYCLRQNSVDQAGDHWPEFQEHADFCFRSMARINPTSKAEALSVFEYLEQKDAMDRSETPGILRNLIAGGWA